MTLKDIIAADEAAVFLNKEDFAEDVTVSPKGTTNKTFTAVAFFTDNPITLQTADGGLVVGTEVKALLLTSVIHAGMLAQITVSRDLDRGDTLTVASGQNAGEWTVVEQALTIGGNQEVTIRLERLRTQSGAQREGRS